MLYFVKGATGFIGKRLIKKLLVRKGSVVHFLLRPESAAKAAAIRDFWGVSSTCTVAVHSDLTTKKLGVSADDVKKLKSQMDHFYHLAGVCDLSINKERQTAINIDGTRNTVKVAKAIEA